MVEDQTHNKIIVLRLDNIGKNKFDAIVDSCFQWGIAYHFTNSNTLEQNGIPKQKTCRLIESVTSMLKKTHLNKSNWIDAIATTCHIQNWSYTFLLIIKPLLPCSIAKYWLLVILEFLIVKHMHIIETKFVKY